MTTIIQDPHATLRAQAETIPASEITSTKIKSVIAAMKKSLNTQDDGVAIAAPQIDVSLRIFVVSKKALDGAEDDVAFINPEIIRLGRKKEYMSEGCLSVRWKYGLVKRATSTTVRAYNEQGNVFVTSGKGLLAQIFQHEIDHLNGSLFIDNAINIEELPPEKSE